MKDYYKILGVDKSVSGTEIKKAFRKRALLIHPDKSRANTKGEFIELFEAYEILSDKKRRDRYDKLNTADTGEVVVEKLNVDIKQILRRGQVYAGDFKLFNSEILGQIVLELFFDPSYVLFASGASILFGVWTIIKGLMSLAWDYSLIGVALTIVGLMLARLKIIEVQKTSR